MAFGVVVLAAKGNAQQVARAAPKAKEAPRKATSAAVELALERKAIDLLKASRGTQYLYAGVCASASSTRHQ